MGKSSYIITNILDNNFIVALLNSKLLNFYFKHRFETTHLSGGYLGFDIPYLKELPIIKLVDTLFETYKLLNEEKLDSNKRVIKGKIEYAEKKIDETVHSLYGLTDEEVSIVEGE